MSNIDNDSTEFGVDVAAYYREQQRLAREIERKATPRPLEIRLTPEEQEANDLLVREARLKFGWFAEWDYLPGELKELYVTVYEGWRCDDPELAERQRQLVLGALKSLAQSSRYAHIHALN